MGCLLWKNFLYTILIIRILVLGGLVCGILLLLSSVFWLFKTLFKRLTWKEYFKRSLSAFGLFALILALCSLTYMSTNVPLMGTVNFFTVTFCIGTILFAVLSIAGFIMTIKRFGQIPNKWTKWYLLVTTTWLLCLVIFYFHYDWIGLRMWSYWQTEKKHCARQLSVCRVHRTCNERPVEFIRPEAEGRNFW